jgi:Mn-dependent DtxR family transcriptional regulator
MTTSTTTAATQTATTPTDRGLLATVRELARGGDSPSSATVAAAVGVPHEYTDFIARRLAQNEERGFVERDPDGCWTLTPAGTAVSGIGWAGATAGRG